MHGATTACGYRYYDDKSSPVLHADIVYLPACVLVRRRTRDKPRAITTAPVGDRMFLNDAGGFSFFPPIHNIIYCTNNIRDEGASAGSVSFEIYMTFL